MSWKTKQKICGTVLRDHPQVAEQYKKYPVKNFDTEFNTLELPTTFDGLETWKDFNTLSPQNRPYSGDWSLVFCKIFKIKLNLLAYRVFFIIDLSKSEILMRIRTPPKLPEPTSLSSLFTGQEKSIFNGFSLIDAVEYCYENGVHDRGCVNYQLYKDAGFDLLTIERGPYQDKIDLLNKHKELLDSGICLKKSKNNMYIAPKTYTLAGIALLSKEDDPIEKAVLAIKQSIYRTGPVLSGMLMYQDFILSDGHEPVEEPSANSIPIGGHAVGIFGWDEKYWIVNTFWNNFGFLGTIKVKIGMGYIERNAIELEIDLPNTKNAIPSTFLMNLNPRLQSFKPVMIDPQTFYTELVTKLLLEKKISNPDGTFVIKKERNLENLIPTRQFFAAFISKYHVAAKVVDVSTMTYLGYFLLFLIINYLVLSIVVKYKK